MPFALMYARFLKCLYLFPNGGEGVDKSILLLSFAQQKTCKRNLKQGMVTKQPLQ
jgi:hypothetical protein